MIYTNRHFQIAVTQLFGFGPKRTRQLLRSLDGLESLFTCSYKQLAEQSGFSISALRRMERQRALDWAVDVVKNLDRFGIGQVFFTDEDYPRRLRQCDDAPLVLYRKGMIDFNPGRLVAVVGTRAISNYGQRVCDELVEHLAGSDVTVVSGLAYGVDIAIHKACVRQGVPTIGVLAHGLEMVYPKVHAPVARKMCMLGGLVSEFPPYTNPDREHFPMRNRIVAGMCDATIVVESKERGESLITAELANDYNRDVFAFPGGIYDVNSQGCNRLITDNKAHLVSGGQEFLLKMGWNGGSMATQKKMFQELTPDEKCIAGYLAESGELHVDVLAMRTGWPVSRLNVLLLQLEMSGVVKSLPGNTCRLA